MLHMHKIFFILNRTICVTMIISQIHKPLTSGLQCLVAAVKFLFFFILGGETLLGQKDIIYLKIHILILALFK